MNDIITGIREAIERDGSLRVGVDHGHEDGDRTIFVASGGSGGSGVATILPALPDSFEDIADVTRTGRLASEAVAREFLATAGRIEEFGRAYHELQMRTVKVLREHADLLEQEAKDGVQAYVENAAEYRELALELFRTIQSATSKTTAAMRICDDLRAYLVSSE